MSSFGSAPGKVVVSSHGIPLSHHVDEGAADVGVRQVDQTIAAEEEVGRRQCVPGQIEHPELVSLVAEPFGQRGNELRQQVGSDIPVNR